MEPYITIWLNTFKAKAIEAGIYGWTNKTFEDISVMKSDEREGVEGQFQSKGRVIFVNTYMWSKNARLSIISSIKNIKSEFDFQNLINQMNSESAIIWRNNFMFAYPAATLPHELEHARRDQQHESRGNPHDVTRTALWEGDSYHERTFDQSANDIFSRVISFGFYKELFEKYKKAKLIG